jgi:hypothetical protein
MLEVLVMIVMQRACRISHDEQSEKRKKKLTWQPSCACSAVAVVLAVVVVVQMLEFMVTVLGLVLGSWCWWCCAGGAMLGVLWSHCWGYYCGRGRHGRCATHV